MKVNEMTTMQKAIYKEIKNKCVAPENEYLRSEKPCEFLSMDISKTRETITCFDGTILTHYEVKTRHTAKKYEDNITVWDVCVYSNGDLGIYFDGKEYRA